MKPAIICTLSVSILLFALISPDLLGQADSTEPALFSQPVIMFVGFVNPDCVPDTLIGFYQKDLRVRPAYLCWGNLFDSERSPTCDSTSYDDRLKPSQIQDTTWFEYPEWNGLQVNVSVLHFNSNDTLTDLLFWTRGNALAVATENGLELRDSSEIEATDSVVYIDTSRSLVVFGQIDLCTQRVVKLKNIKGAQSRPYAAMQLGYAVDLIEPKRREHSGKLSWKLRKVRQTVDSVQTEDSTSSPPPTGLASVKERDVTAQVFPNPAVYSATVAVRPLPAGTYSVELVAADGETVTSYQLDLHDEGSVLETLDLTTLSSGHYFVRVRTGDRIIGDYPIIVVR